LKAGVWFHRCFDAVLELLVDRTELQVVLEILKCRLDFDDAGE
jgi:hypothetical protein